MKLISSRQYTSLGDATTAARLMEASHRYLAHTNIRYSRYLSLRELKSGNFILIGSRRGIPWEQLFEPQLNFYLEENHLTRRFEFHNRAPVAGEKTVYVASDEGPTGGDTYADIALLPNLGGTGHVLILAGIDMAAAEAAGELVTSAEFQTTLARMLSVRSVRSANSLFEILIQTTAIRGTPGGSKILAYRLLK